MQLKGLITIAYLAGTVWSSVLITDSTQYDAAFAGLDKLAAVAREIQDTNFAEVAKRGGSRCTKWNTSVRKEWGTLSKQERIAYTDAVLCFQSKAALTPRSIIPGVRSRFDDYVGTHINQTLTIHYTGTFLGWHRYFLWNYEQALRTECGYKGAQPYWNWALFSDKTTSNPVFDGSKTSMSGNGAFIPGKPDLMLQFPGFDPLTLPAGNGGGCVTSGPFKNMRVNLGPLPPPGSNSTPGEGLAYNPRCLKRDIGSKINTLFANATSIHDLLTNYDDIASFQMNMQGAPGSGSIGVHGGGHYTIAGDPGGDTFTSPGDPAFYLHHGMIDRVWWLWQQQNLRKRQNAVAGPGFLLGLAPAPNTTLDTLIDIGYADHTEIGPIALRELMSTTSGPFCYTYDSL